MLVDPEGVGFGSAVDHTEKIAEPVPPLATIPLSDSQKEALELRPKIALYYQNTESATFHL